MSPRFGLLREALEHLSWDAPTQRRHFDGAVATDELALDLDNALVSLPHECERLAVTLEPDLAAALAELHTALGDAPGSGLWDPASLDSHPTWAFARCTAARLLERLTDEGTRPP